MWRVLCPPPPQQPRQQRSQVGIFVVKVRKSQIRKFLGTFRFRKSADFLCVPVRKPQMRKFTWLFSKSIQLYKILQNSVRTVLKVVYKYLQGGNVLFSDWYVRDLFADCPPLRILRHTSNRGLIVVRRCWAAVHSAFCICPNCRQFLPVFSSSRRQSPCFRTLVPSFLSTIV
jgi:hypothetical protein